MKIYKSLLKNEGQYSLSLNPKDENDDDLNRNVYRDVGGAGQGTEWRSSRRSRKNVEICHGLALKCRTLKITERMFSWFYFPLFFFPPVRGNKVILVVNTFLKLMSSNY